MPLPDVAPTDVPTTLTLRTERSSETQAVGACFAGFVTRGDVLALSGELGAGKTCFVQGLASGLGIEGPVTSPTFVLVRSYVGRLPLVHVDVYRLQRLQDVLDLGDEVFASDVLTCIEWGDAVASLLPEDRVDVEIVHTEASDGAGPSDERRLRITLRGHWSERSAELETALARWRTGVASC